ncbi:HlyD family efflux transporter periplasmic adaptor subunit [Cyclobacteriaceae bacterium]|nr:HlyD family efflux transporter periplasmic adaptor subunit [Cyclobacteriaceae bacterium]
MKTRQYIILGVIFLIVGSTIAFNNFLKTSATKKKDKPHSEFKIESKVITVTNQDYPAEVTLTGRVRSFDRIDLFAEVTGVSQNTKPQFREGNKFRKGQVLVKLDDREMRLQLVSKKSLFINSITKLIPDLKVDYPQDSPTWEKYLNTLDPHKTIPPLPQITNKKLVYFISGRNINDAYYDIKSQETKLAKHTIRAPFSGIVKSSSITQGTLIRSGQSLGEFISTEGYELEAAISFKDLKFVKMGHEVTLHSSDLDQDWKGKIYRIGDVINESTQTINVYIKIIGNDVKEGMYLKGNIGGYKITNAFAIPRLLLQPGNKIFVVQDNQLIHQEVDVIKVNNDQVIIKGLNNGTQIIAKPLARAIEGTKVEIIKEQ